MTTADTPYAILCSECVPGHVITIALSESQYLAQMSKPSRKWHCPECGEEAVWDDDTYESWLDHNQDTLTEDPEGVPV